MRNLLLVLFLVITSLLYTPSTSFAGTSNNEGLFEAVRCFIQETIFQKACTEAVVVTQEVPEPYTLSDNPQFRALSNAYKSLQASLRAQGTVTYSTTTIHTVHTVTQLQPMFIATPGGFDITSIDCAEYGGGGKLTTKDGTIICANDRSGGGNGGGSSNTDEQTLSFDTGTNILSIAGGNTVDLSTLAVGGTSTVASLEDITDVASFSQTTGDLIYWNGSAWANIATSSLGLSGGSGTVSSVGLAVPTGLTVSGSPVTTTGTLTIGLDTGYTIPRTASTTNWQTTFSWGNHASSSYLSTTTGNWLGTFDGQEGSYYLNLANATGDTDDVTEGAINQYFTNARVSQYITGSTTISLLGQTISAAELLANTNTAGYVLQASSTASGGFAWVATSTLNLTGGVTSIAASVPTGWTIGGSPITDSGTLTFDYDTGYAAVLAASTTNWQTAFSWGDHSLASYLTDITGESLESLSDVASFSQSSGDLLYWNGSAWSNIATSSLGITAGASPTATTTASGIGMISGFPMAACPAGWIQADGAAVSRTTYADLYAEIGVTYGSGNGTSTFNLPDYRGEFLRGFDDGAGTDPDAASRTDRGDGTTGDNVGTKQGDEFESHTHNLTSNLTGTSNGWNLTGGGGTFYTGPLTSVTSATGNSTETRPTNISVNYCISFRGGVSSGILTANGLDAYFTSGNLSIGTTTASSKLTVYGNALFSGPSRYLNFGSIAGTSGYGIRDNAGTLQFKNDSGAWADFGSGGAFTESGTSAYFNNNGNISIGTTSTSSARLTIQSTSTNNILSLFETGGQEVFTVLENGNVGIGTTSPTQKLSVDGLFYISGIGTSTITDNLHVQGNLKVGTSSLLITTNGIRSTGDLILEAGTGSNIIFGDENATTTFYADAQTGLVGIGTTTPTQTLTVDGDFSLTGSLYDSLGSAGTAGMVLQSTGSGLRWVATSTLGLASDDEYQMVEDGWVDTGSTLPGNLARSQLAVVGDFIYLFGGYTGAAYDANIYKASTSDPTVWEDTGNNLPTGFNNSNLAIIGNNIYLFGGFNGSYFSNIYKATTSDPTVWEDTGATLPTTVGSSQAVVIDNFVYLFGGLASGAESNIIYKASTSDPTVWEDTGSTLPGIVRIHQAVIIGDYVYIFGGSGGNNVIYRAPLSDPTNWSDTGATLPAGIGESQAVVVGNYVYLLGGDISGTEMANIYRASVLDPTVWVDTGEDLPGNLDNSQVAIIDEFVYLFGGDNGTAIDDVIYRAPLLNNSNLASNNTWKTQINGADLAELYPAASSSIEAGDLVSFTNDDEYQLAYATKGNNLPLAGIVATNPGVTLKDGTEGPTAKPLALSGRVPTKVNLEGGVIVPGDRITPSSVPGEGKKAGLFDPSVGTALTGYDITSTSTETQLVTVFIDLQKGLNADNLTASLFEGASTTFLLPQANTDATSSITTKVSDQVVSIWTRLADLASRFVDGVLTVVGIKADSVQTEELCIGVTCISEVELKALLLEKDIEVSDTDVEGDRQEEDNSEDEDSGQTEDASTTTISIDTGGVATSTEEVATSTEEIDEEEEVLTEEIVESEPEEISTSTPSVQEDIVEEELVTTETEEQNTVSEEGLESNVEEPEEDSVEEEPEEEPVSDAPAEEGIL